MAPRTSSFQHGSALLLVLWSLILLSMSVVGVVEIVESSVSHASHLELESQARALALSGLAVAMNPDVQINNSLLKHEVAPGQKWNVSLLGEGGRLNLNRILANNHREILVRLFEQWGVEADDAQHAADCLYNWVTPQFSGLTGTQQHVGASGTATPPPPKDGVKADYVKAGLKHFPTNQPFTSLAEPMYVLGMDKVEKARPNWKDSFTLWSEGPLDVNEAPPESLAAVLNLPISMTQAFTARRNGKDEIVGTLDDVTIPDMKTLKLLLGLGDKIVTAYSSELSFSDSIRRIESRGVANGVGVTVSVVARLKSSPPDYLLWNEL